MMSIWLCDMIFTFSHKILTIKLCTVLFPFRNCIGYDRLSHARPIARADSCRSCGSPTVEHMHAWWSLLAVEGELEVVMLVAKRLVIKKIVCMQAVFIG